MQDSSIDSRAKYQDPELAKRADEQLPVIDPHGAGATPSHAVVRGTGEHGFGAALPAGEAFKPRDKSKK